MGGAVPAMQWSAKLSDRLNRGAFASNVLSICLGRTLLVAGIVPRNGVCIIDWFV